MQRVPCCAFCFKPYAFKGSGRPVGQRIPRLLSCGHTFCEGCTTKLPEIRPRVIQCPTCAGETALDGGKKSVRNLPTNLYILGVLIDNIRATIEKDVIKGELTDIDLEKSLNEARGPAIQTPVSVEEDGVKVCDECCSNAAVSGCKKCEAVYCENCFASVHSSRTLRMHEVVPLSFDNKGVEMKECETHQGRELEFYDQTDEKLICSLCIVTPAYQGHKIVPVHELTEEVSEEVKQSLEKVKKVHYHLQKSKGNLSALFPKIKAECSEVVQHIREHFQDLHTKLQAREFSLINEVKDAYCSKSFPAEVIKEISQQTEELDTLIKQGAAALSTHSIILNMGETLSSKMADFEDIPCILSESFVQDFVKISYPEEFQDALNSYGTIVTESCSLKLKKISEQPDGDAVVVNEVAVTNNAPEDESKEITSPTRSGSALLTMPSRQNLVHVTHVKHPCDFMVQHVADEERIENLMDAINQYYVTSKNMSDVVKSTQVGDLVCAKFSKDQSWYRARIIGEQQHTSVPGGRNQPLPKVEVCYIDYGNTEVLPLNKLRKIQPEFADIPELATNCSLVDIVPPGQSDTWPAYSTKAFGSLIRDKPLLMCVLKKSGGKLFVDLKSPQEEPTKDDDKPASVRDALVFLEVAHFSSPVSVANPEVTFPVRTYKKTTLPEEGETLGVTVTYTETPDAVYVIRDTGKEYADMLKVIGQMSRMYSTKKENQWQILWPYKGLVCAARFTGDNVWYRALVTKVTADKIVQVFYVDFGNSEELPFSEIRRIPDHMTQLPMQAMKCRLAGIQPVDEEEVWSSECVSMLANNCSLNQYNMRVIEAEGDEPMAVVLYPDSTAETQDVTSVNQLLVLNSHASLSGDVESLEAHVTNTQEPSSPASTTSQTIPDADLCYLPVHMPQSKKFQIVVGYVDKDCTISGYQPGNGNHSLPELMQLVQKVCEATEQPLLSQDQLSFNQPCCAKFENDDYWYRALVVGFPTPSSVLAEYVDFGNMAEIPLPSIKLNAAFLEIPRLCLSIHLDGLPQTPNEQTEVAELLEGVLIGRACEAVSSIKPTVHSPIKVESLTLPDGSDVVDVVREMMLKKHGGEEESQKIPPPLQQPVVKTQQDDSRMTMKAKRTPEQGKSLFSDTVLPPEGVLFDVCVTQVNTTNVMFLQRAEEETSLAHGHDPTRHIAHDHLVQLEKMSAKINLTNYFKGKPDVSNVWSAMLCCAQYTVDDLWYRAQVIKVMSHDPLEAYVLYVDYGTSEVIGLDRIKPFPGELLSLPKQAFQCAVIGLSESEEQDCESDNAAVDFISEAVADKKLICKIVSSESSPILVELYERVFKEQSHVDVPLSQRLLELGQMTDETDGFDDSVVGEGDELSSAEEKPALKADNAQTEDFTSDVEPVGDWHTECEEPIMKYDREGMSTRPQLLTPAQFLLKKESSVKPENDAKSEEQTESEVD